MSTDAAARHDAGDAFVELPRVVQGAASVASTRATRFRRQPRRSSSRLVTSGYGPLPEGWNRPED